MPHKINKILPKVINKTKRQGTHEERGFTAKITLLNFSLAVWSWFVCLGLEPRGLASSLWRLQAGSAAPRPGYVGLGGWPRCGAWHVGLAGDKAIGPIVTRVPPRAGAHSGRPLDQEPSK